MEGRAEEGWVSGNVKGCTWKEEEEAVEVEEVPKRDIASAVVVPIPVPPVPPVPVPVFVFVVSVEEPDVLEDCCPLDDLPEPLLSPLAIPVPVPIPGTIVGTPPPSELHEL